MYESNVIRKIIITLFSNDSQTQIPTGPEKRLTALDNDFYGVSKTGAAKTGADGILKKIPAARPGYTPP